MFCCFATSCFPFLVTLFLPHLTCIPAGHFALILLSPILFDAPFSQSLSSLLHITSGMRIASFPFPQVICFVNRGESSTPCRTFPRPLLPLSEEIAVRAGRPSVRHNPPHPHRHDITT